MTIHHQDSRVTLHHGDCLDVLRTLPDASVDAVVTDPPYGLEFMGKDWDKFTSWTTRDGKESRGKGRDPFVSAQVEKYRAGLPFQQWCTEWAAECLRVLKPGGHLLAFGGTRTWHRLACAVEDAGFEVRDSLAWLHGQGFPKSQNVSKALGDKRCQCETVESTHDGDVRGVRDGVSETAEPRRSGEVTDLLAPVQREGARPGVGEVRSAGTEDARPLRPEAGTGEPGMEGRRDLQAPEGELCGSALREVPSGVPGDGTGGRLRDGAPSSDGSQVGPVSAPVGSGEPHQPRPTGQPAGELGAVPVERGSQAWGGWPVCGRCGKPSIPDGLGTAAKPAFEPVVVARKPLVGTVAANVLTHGTGALNIEACRIGTGDDRTSGGNQGSAPQPMSWGEATGRERPTGGRWPANVILDEDMADVLDEQSGTSKSPPVGSVAVKAARVGQVAKGDEAPRVSPNGHGDSGGASRFFKVVDAGRTERIYSVEEIREAAAWDKGRHAGFTDALNFRDGQGEHSPNPYRDAAKAEPAPFLYQAKAPKRERPVVDGVAHPTVKPLALMRWLVRLVTPPGGTVLEPFAGSGTTVEACLVEGFHCIAIEKGDEYLPLIRERIRRQTEPPEVEQLTRRTDPEAAIVEQVREMSLFELDGEGA